MLEIVNKKLCSGCGLCAAICPQTCIKMEQDEEGFWYPKVDSVKCVKCGLCEKKCSEHNLIYKSSSNSTLYGAQTINDNYRASSTAGGFFYTVADYVLRNNGVVYGAVYKNGKIVHQRVDSVKDIKPLLGSKYVQSDLKDAFIDIKKILLQERMVLFAGTPCQVHGLINFVGSQENLITIDLLCLGVSSPAIFSSYIDFLESKYKDIVYEYQFRNKNYGYSTGNPCVVFQNGGIIEQNYDSKCYANLFFKYYNVRPSCYECHYRVAKRVSDFTIGDFVNIGEYSHELDDNLGTTRVWAHTKKGKEIINSCAETMKIIEIENNTDNIIGGPLKQIDLPQLRSEFFQDYKKSKNDFYSFLVRWEPRSIKFELICSLRKASKYIPPLQWLSKIVRTLQYHAFHNKFK